MSGTSSILKRTASAPRAALAVARRHVPGQSSYAAHLLAASAYGALALGLDDLLQIPAGPAGYVSGAAFAVCGLVHLNAVGLARQHRLRRELQAGQQTVSKLGREMLRIAEQLATLREGGPFAQSKQVDEVINEVKMLQALIEQLYAARTQNQAAALAGAKADDPQWTSMAKGGLSNADAAIAALLEEALRDDNVVVALQPTVTLPKGTRIGYECFSRIRARDGRLIMPQEYLEVAERLGLVTALDNLLLFRCIKMIGKLRRHGVDMRFFCNISHHTLADRSFFKGFVKMMKENAVLAESVVFEFKQSAFMTENTEVTKDLAVLAGLGYGYSIDQVTDLNLDPKLLKSRHVRYVKVEATRLLNDPIAARALKSKLNPNGIQLVIEKIETEEVLDQVRTFGGSFGQGYLFGEPQISQEPAAAKSAA